MKQHTPPRHPIAQAARAALTTLVDEAHATPLQDLVTAVSDVVGAALDNLEHEVRRLDAAVAELVTKTVDQDRRIRALEEVAAKLLARLP